jgi:hypothetical protein
MQTGGLEQAPPFPRKAARWLFLFSTAPVVWLTAFYIYVLRAVAVLGRWPAPHSPDPPSLGFELHYHLIFFGLAWVPLAGVGVLMLALWAIWRDNYHDAFIALVTYIGSLIGAIVLLQRDPGQLLQWFIG